MSESLSRCSRDTRLVFIGLWTCADDDGRFRADPRYLAGQLLPYDADGLETINRALAELLAEGSVQLYEADGSSYGWVTGWSRHQRIDRPSASRLPSPPPFTQPSGIKLANPREGSRDLETPTREGSRATPPAAREASCEDQGEDQGEEGSREGSREQGGTAAAGKKRKAKQEQLPGVPPKPVPVRPPSRIARLWEEFQGQRRDKLTMGPEVGGLEMAVAPPDDPPDWGRSAATLAQWVKLWPDLTEEQVDNRLANMMCAWLEVPYWASCVDREGKPRTPYPWGAFITEKQWRGIIEEPAEPAEGVH